MALAADPANELAKAAQGGVPLVERPWDALAEAVDVPPAAVLAQLRAWSEEGKLREISAVLEGETLGYESALVAATVPAGDLDRVVSVVNAHPTVTHDYLRDHPLNLWFTVAVPVEMGIDPTLRLLEAEAGVESMHALRRSAVFKIGVRFDMKSLKNETVVEAPESLEPVAVGPRERMLFRALQSPLPLVERPFASLARGWGVSEAELLEFGRAHLRGAVRRYVATFRHRKLGVSANGMVVWRVEPEREKEVGATLASAPEVSHCYARNPVPGFPYTVYSMVHGPDEDACRAVAAELSARTGVSEYAVLFSTREFKKVRLRYFLPELDAWWNARAAREVAHGR